MESKDLNFPDILEAASSVKVPAGPKNPIIIFTPVIIMKNKFL
jgi:hypothetical protein